jgi:Phosphotransferase enzyme family
MLADIGSCFAITGDYVSCEKYDGGHINDTYFATYRDGDCVRRYVHQRINKQVFADVNAVSANIALVTNHIRARLQLQGIPDVDRRVLTLIPTRDGHNVLATEQGDHWRTYAYIERSSRRLHVQTKADAFRAARAFGEFAAALADIPVQMLHESIPAFHDTSARFESLIHAIDGDACNRAAKASHEIAEALRLQSLTCMLANLASSACLPIRATHNDTKITNVLFDETSGEAVCVVDLDTVMPGLTLFDVGELVRTAGTRAAEDEQDVGKVQIDPELFEAVAAGFIQGADGLCLPQERDGFITAGKVLAFENGIRFLADYLNGDRYFRVHRADQNLHRARAQFALVNSLERQEEDLHRRLALVSRAA